MFVWSITIITFSKVHPTIIPPQPICLWTEASNPINNNLIHPKFTHLCLAFGSPVVPETCHKRDRRLVLVDHRNRTGSPHLSSPMLHKYSFIHPFSLSCTITLNGGFSFNKVFLFYRLCNSIQLSCKTFWYLLLSQTRVFSLLKWAVQFDEI